jgi:hypothetical protein
MMGILDKRERKYDDSDHSVSSLGEERVRLATRRAFTVQSFSVSKTNFCRAFDLFSSLGFSLYYSDVGYYELCLCASRCIATQKACYSCRNSL